MKFIHKIFGIIEDEDEGLGVLVEIDCLDIWFGVVGLLVVKVVFDDDVDDAVVVVVVDEDKIVVAIINGNMKI